MTTANARWLRVGIATILVGVVYLLALAELR